MAPLARSGQAARRRSSGADILSEAQLALCRRAATLSISLEGMEAVYLPAPMLISICMAGLPVINAAFSKRSALNAGSVT